MSEQFKAATIRALYGALLTVGSVFFVALQTMPPSPTRVSDAAIAGASAFFAYMIARGVAEGTVDSIRNRNGDVTPSDVGAFDPPIK